MVLIGPKRLRTFEAVRTYYAQNDVKVMLPDLQDAGVVM